MNGKFSLLIWSALLLFPFVSAGQKTDFTWYIGNRVMEFHRTTNEPTASPNSITLTGPGAVVSDPTNGDILFYTDGVNVYDATNQVMVNGTGLQADVAGNQTVAVAKVPGTTSQYFIITNSATGAIQYSIVDMSLQGNQPNAAGVPLGAVISKNTAVLGPGMANQSNGMIVVPHDNGTDFFLITHQSGTTNYNVCLVTGNTITQSSSISIGQITNVNNISYNAETKQLAIAPGEAGKNVEILNIDTSGTGTLSLEASLPLTSTTATQGVYDVAWSPFGDALYISTTNQNGQPDLLRYELSNITVPPPSPLISPASVLPQPSTITASYGLQIGPDSSIYHLYQNAGGQVVMGKVDFPSDPTDPTSPPPTYVAQAVTGAFTETQFPATLPGQDVAITADFTFKQPCLNVPTQFFPTISQPVDSVNWVTIVNGQPEVISSEWSPIHTFDAAGTVAVTMNAYIDGEIVATVTHDVNVIQFDVQITLDPEITGCHEEFKDAVIEPPGWVPCETQGGAPCLQVTAQVSGGGTMQWFGPDGPIAGANTATFKPETPGYYWLEVESGGCTAYAGINVKEYEVQDPKAYTWYFGNGAAIDFNPTVQQPNPSNPIDLSNTSGMDAPEGTATVSDRNGKLVFYTDGQTVWKRDNPTPITTNLGGDPTSTQSALIMPVPGDETLYYIFTTSEITTGEYEVRYAVFDRKLDPTNGIGDLVDPTPADATDPMSTVLFTKGTERLLGVDNWVIVHEYGNNNFRAYQVTAEGISDPVFSNVGSDHSVLSTATAEGYMMYGAGRIAVALSGPSGNFVEVFDFDAATGEITNPRIINVPRAGQVYGVGFSSGGEKMFVTVIGHNEILEYYYDTATDTYVLMPATIAVPAQPGAIQRGMGGLYVSVVGQHNLGLIQENTDRTINSIYNPNGVAMDTPDGNFAGETTLGLPNFVQNVGNPLQTPGLSAENACVNSDVVFTASGKDSTIDQFDWFFHDGTEMLDAGPEVTKNYPVAGTYKVRVLIYNKCKPKLPVSDPNYPGGGEGFQEMDIVIHPTPLDPIMLRNNALPIICTDNAPVTLFGNDPADPVLANLDYTWSNGAGNVDRISVTTPGTYNVTLTDRVTGCSNTGQQQVGEYFNVNLGPDIDLCSDRSALISVGFDVRAQYQWFRNGAPVRGPDNNNEYVVNTAPDPGSPLAPGTYTYKVEVFDQRCRLSDEILVNVNPVPQYTFTANPDNNCALGGPGNGSIVLNFTAPVGRDVSYTVSGPSGTVGSGIVTPATVIPAITGLSSGAYTASVNDVLSGCPNPQIISIDGNAFGVNATLNPGCHPDMTIDVALTGGTGPFNYEVRGTVGGVPNSIVASGTRNASPFTTDALGQIQDGSYKVLVSQASNPSCWSSADVTVTQNPPYSVFIDNANLCAANNQVTLAFQPGSPATDAIPINWRAEDANGQNTGLSTQFPPSGMSASLIPGTWRVSVTATSPGAPPSACPVTVTRTVTVNAPLDPEFTQSNACVAPVRLTATTTAPPQLYEWIRDNQTFGFGNPITIPAAEDGKTFVLETTAANGCVEQFSDVVHVISPFTVTLDVVTDPICEDSDFQLAAIPSRAGITEFVWSYNGSPLAGSTATITDSRAGLYAVFGRIAGCESQPDDENISFLPKPAVDLGPLKRICPYPAAPDEQQSAILDPGTFDSYEWYLVTDNGLEPLNATGQTYAAVAPGTYSVEVTGTNGCTNTDQVEVLEECDPIITGPNAFRPGGTNKAFSLLTFFISDEDFEILIFNRWGEMVYNSTDRQFAWNGGYKGDPGKILPAGTYAYVVKYRSEDFPDQGVKEKRGGVILLQ